MSWTIWQMLRNIAIIEEETKKEAYKEILKELYALPRGADYIQNKLHVLCLKYEKKVKELDTK